MVCVSTSSLPYTLAHALGVHVRFWPGGSTNGNTVARTIVARRNLDRWQQARLFVLLNIPNVHASIHHPEAGFIDDGNYRVPGRTGGSASPDHTRKPRLGDLHAKRPLSC